MDQRGASATRLLVAAPFAAHTGHCTGSAFALVATSTLAASCALCALPLHHEQARGRQLAHTSIAAIIRGWGAEDRWGFAGEPEARLGRPRRGRARCGRFGAAYLTCKFPWRPAGMPRFGRAHKAT